ncbi:extracellular solute-binding protein [Mesorhizobium retamae]|uniref:Extracellular solute-binding protein n=1 Tax=Mesorhizobium retamae TaxID=2912854 RepID=A0ABS9QJF1_9HYPH|nr:extracellular solute-binding protein [Mesorhizobium sp. IRAMC:0171]MCG7507564.1 extracellular solute-binding protein [Mesorhizobium sp. IRAMC:0171]
MAGPSRRDVLALGAATAAVALLPSRVFAASPTETPLHGLSAFGDLKYAAGFSNFDYVNPEAPKGGTFNFSPFSWLFNQNPQTFNTLNSFILKGDSPPRMEMCFDSLMASALDEPDSMYGLVAKTVTIAPDRNSFTFKLRPEARFHDGSPLTAEDAAFSYKLLKSDGAPDFAIPLARLADAVADDKQTLRLIFDGKQSERLILSIIGFPILSRTDIETNGFKGGMRPLLGSGAYKVGRVSPGQTIEYERVADYWARDLNVNRGQNNFDRIRIDFYLDRRANFEALKKGDTFYREESVSRSWALDYDFPSLKEGRVVKREFPTEKRPRMQAIALNHRRDRFNDVRVRQAIGLCFDFEWAKRNFFYDLYNRSQSLFELSDFRAEGKPGAEELALLEPLRGNIPEEAFGEAVLQPVSDGSGRDRKMLGKASKLLADAGWKRTGSFVENDKGEKLTLEMLSDEEVLSQRFSPFIENMRAVGIDATSRIVDTPQYQRRLSEYDFDLVIAAFLFSPSPTQDEMEQFFHSRSAAMPGTRNYAGISDPAVDTLVDAVGAAKDRQSLIIAMRALDRVLRARHDWIPNYHNANHWVAFWDMFGFKEPKPDYAFPIESLWWFDKNKAAKIGKA